MNSLGLFPGIPRYTLSLSESQYIWYSLCLGELPTAPHIHLQRPAACTNALPWAPPPKICTTLTTPPTCAPTAAALDEMHRSPSQLPFRVNRPYRSLHRALSEVDYCCVKLRIWQGRIRKKGRQGQETRTTNLLEDGC